MCKLLVLILIQAIWCIVSTASTREVTCYYRNWMQNAKKGKAKFLPEDIDASLCSVIKYAFLRINDTTNVLEMTQKNDGEMLRKISDLKKVNPSLKVEVAIGEFGLFLFFFLSFVLMNHICCFCCKRSLVWLDDEKTVKIYLFRTCFKLNVVVLSKLWNQINLDGILNQYKF